MTEIISLLIAGLAILTNPTTKLIEGKQQKRLKEQEVLLQKRLQVYEKFIAYSAEFVYNSSEDGPEYLEYLKLSQTASLIASEDTYKKIKKLSITANKLRSETDRVDKTILQASEWHECFESVCDEMRKDIKKLSDKVYK